MHPSSNKRSASDGFPVEDWIEICVFFVDRWRFPQIEEVNEEEFHWDLQREPKNVFQVTWRCCNKHHLLLRTTIWESKEDKIRTKIKL